MRVHLIKNQIRIIINKPVFIDLRIASALLLFGGKKESAGFLQYVTDHAAVYHNTITEMYSNELQMDKVTDNFR